MSNAISDTLFMTQRHLRNLFRQPAWILISLVQPVVWLLLYGALFRRIVEIPGFGAGSYIDFLTPGIVVMTCLFSAGWSGMGLIDDLDRGVVDRFLVSPASRGSLIAGRLVQGALVGVIQSAIIIVLGLIVGAQYPGGIGGIVALTICAVLLGTGVGALSNGIALLSRKEETMIAVSNFVLLPLTFLSSVFMAQALMPGWMQGVAKYNPVNGAVEAGRAGIAAGPDWGLVFTRMAWLLVFTVVCTWLSTRAFRVYQRSI
jgi:ABC-2 type transport system permease protein